MKIDPIKMNNTVVRSVLLKRSEVSVTTKDALLQSVNNVVVNIDTLLPLRTTSSLQGSATESVTNEVNFESIPGSGTVFHVTTDTTNNTNIKSDNKLSRGAEMLIDFCDVPKINTNNTNNTENSQNEIKNDYHTHTSVDIIRAVQINNSNNNTTNKHTNNSHNTHNTHNTLKTQNKLDNNTSKHDLVVLYRKSKHTDNKHNNNNTHNKAGIAAAPGGADALDAQRFVMILLLYLFIILLCHCSVVLFSQYLCRKCVCF
jgi:hypothetical protein